MARDLHDVVAHNISVINVQANTALHLMDRQPDRARSALTTINEVSKQALAELRSVLGVLRDVDAQTRPGLRPRAWPAWPTWSTPPPRPGSPSGSRRSGRQAPLPADVDLAAYRIIQEALTNTARHSGGANATVRIAYGDAALLVEVDDDGRPGRRADPRLTRTARAMASPG